MVEKLSLWSGSSTDGREVELMVAKAHPVVAKGHPRIRKANPTMLIRYPAMSNADLDR